MTTVGEQLALEGIGRARDGADPEWYAAAMRAVRRRVGEFTTDDVWQELDGFGYVTSEPRAMGAVMRQAALDGVVVATDRYRKSIRPECHARPVRVWKAA